MKRPIIVLVIIFSSFVIYGQNSDSISGKVYESQISAIGEKHDSTLMGLLNYYEYSIIKISIEIDKKLNQGYPGRESQINDTIYINKLSEDEKFISLVESARNIFHKIDSIKKIIRKD